MTRRSRWVWVVSACAMVATLSPGQAGAADKTRVDQATEQVAEGARSIGYGEFGPGFGDLFMGIGRTIVEGVVYGGKTLGELFRSAVGEETIDEPESSRGVEPGTSPPTGKTSG